MRNRPAQVHVQPAVVVQIAEVRRHRGNRPVQPVRARYVGERPIVVVVKQVRDRRAVWLAQLKRADILLRCGRVAAGKNIQSAVIVVIEKPGGKGVPVAAQASLLGHVGKNPLSGLRMAWVARAVVAK